MKKRLFKMIGSTLLTSSFLFMAFGSLEDESPEEIKKENMKGVTINGNSATIEHFRRELSSGDVTIWYICDKIWQIEKDYPNVNHINITISEKCKDSYGYEKTYNTNFEVTAEDLQRWQPWNYADNDSFSEKMVNSGQFSTYNPCYNF